VGELMRRITAGTTVGDLNTASMQAFLSGEPLGSVAGTGETITPQRALGIPAIYQGIRLLASLPASLPLKVYRAAPDGRGASPARDHPNFPLLYHAPNPWQTSYQWRVAMGMSLHLRGNAYSSLIWDKRGNLQEIHWLHPDRVEVWLDRSGLPVYKVKLNPATNETTMLSRFEMHHLWTETMDGYAGMSAIEMCRESIALAVGAEGFATRLMANGAQPSGILTLPAGMTAEARAAAKLSWDEAHRGLGNAGRTAVIPADVKFEPLTMKLADAQWVEMRRLSKEEMATLLGLPGDFLTIAGGQMGGVTGVEQRFIQALVLRFNPILVAWEQALQRDVFTPEELDVVYPRFNRSALLQTDTLTRYRVYSIGRQISMLNPNECRALEELNPYEGGDEYDKPANMLTVPGGTQPQEPPAVEDPTADLDHRLMASVEAALAEGTSAPGGNHGA
jgi:HK97 family phage portal protein